MIEIEVDGVRAKYKYGVWHCDDATIKNFIEAICSSIEYGPQHGFPEYLMLDALRHQGAIKIALRVYVKPGRVY